MKTPSTRLSEIVSTIKTKADRAAIKVHQSNRRYAKVVARAMKRER